MFDYRNSRFVPLLATICAALLAVGCDSLSGIVPTGDTEGETVTADNSGATTPQSTRASQSAQGGPQASVQHRQGPNQGTPPGEGQMAEMMAGEGEMPIPGGPPDDMDTADIFSAQLGTAIPDDGGPGDRTGTEDYFSSGGLLPDPANGAGAPGDFEDGTTGYLETVNGGAGALFNPDDYDVHGNYIGGAKLKGAGKPAAGGAKPPGKANTPGRESVLRNKDPRARPNPQPAQRPGDSPAKAGSSTAAKPAPGFSEQPLFRLSNPVAHFDGTGFSLGFSIDYQLHRAPENGAIYYWVISYEELDKSGRGSQLRRKQVEFRPADSSTLKIVVPLTGKPKEPYRCAIWAKKDGKAKQVSRQANFPPTFK